MAVDHPPATSVAAAARPMEQQASDLYPTPAMRAHFEEHGYCVVDDAVDPAMLPGLLAASRRIRDRVHAGTLTHGFMHRTGRDAPLSDLREPWGIRGVFSPIHSEPVFADYIGHSHLTRYVCGFTGCEREEQLGLGTTVLFCNPRDDDYTIGWHRDGGGTEGYGQPDHDTAVEREKWEKAGWPDRSPGGPRTPEKRKSMGFQIAMLDSDAVSPLTACVNVLFPVWF